MAITTPSFNQEEFDYYAQELLNRYKEYIEYLKNKNNPVPAIDHNNNSSRKNLYESLRNGSAPLALLSLHMQKKIDLTELAKEDKEVISVFFDVFTSSEITAINRIKDAIKSACNDQQQPLSRLLIAYPSDSRSALNRLEQNTVISSEQKEKLLQLLPATSYVEEVSLKNLLSQHDSRFMDKIACHNVLNTTTTWLTPITPDQKQGTTSLAIDIQNGLCVNAVSFPKQEITKEWVAQFLKAPPTNTGTPIITQQHAQQIQKNYIPDMCDYVRTYILSAPLMFLRSIRVIPHTSLRRYQNAQPTSQLLTSDSDIVTINSTINIHIQIGGREYHADVTITLRLNNPIEIIDIVTTDVGLLQLLSVLDWGNNNPKDGCYGKNGYCSNIAKEENEENIDKNILLFNSAMLKNGTEDQDVIYFFNDLHLGFALSEFYNHRNQISPSTRDNIQKIRKLLQETYAKGEKITKKIASDILQNLLNIIIQHHKELNPVLDSKVTALRSLLCSFFSSKEQKILNAYKNYRANIQNQATHNTLIKILEKTNKAPQILLLLLLSGQINSICNNEDITIVLRLIDVFSSLEFLPIIAPFLLAACNDSQHPLSLFFQGYPYQARIILDHLVTHAIITEEQKQCFSLPIKDVDTGTTISLRKLINEPDIKKTLIGTMMLSHNILAKREWIEENNQPQSNSVGRRSAGKDAFINDVANKNLLIHGASQQIDSTNSPCVNTFLYQTLSQTFSEDQITKILTNYITDINGYLINILSKIIMLFENFGIISPTEFNRISDYTGNVLAIKRIKSNLDRNRNSDTVELQTDTRVYFHIGRQEYKALVQEQIQIDNPIQILDISITATNDKFAKLLCSILWGINDKETTNFFTNYCSLFTKLSFAANETPNEDQQIFLQNIARVKNNGEHQDLDILYLLSDLRIGYALSEHFPGDLKTVFDVTDKDDPGKKITMYQKIIEIRHHLQKTYDSNTDRHQKEATLAELNILLYHITKFRKCPRGVIDTDTKEYLMQKYAELNTPGVIIAAAKTAVIEPLKKMVTTVTDIVTPAAAPQQPTQTSTSSTFVSFASSTNNAVNRLTNSTSQFFTNAIGFFAGLTEKTKQPNQQSESAPEQHPTS